jgi:hypothetical protein
MSRHHSCQAGFLHKASAVSEARSQKSFSNIPFLSTSGKPSCRSTRASISRSCTSGADFLFLFRLTVVGKSYLNKVLIPTLCRKAGVPTADVRGNITSHRGRSTIASQLFNAKEPMTLFELQEWLGHSTPAATQHYAKITPIKLAKSYADAGYFARNLPAIELLVDQEIVRSGRAATEPWKFYDLGHGYCTYDFFEQCQHRMACAKCSFYVPEGSSQVQLLQGKANLLQLRQEIPLNDSELAAVTESRPWKNCLNNWPMSQRRRDRLRVNLGIAWATIRLKGS